MRSRDWNGGSPRGASTAVLLGTSCGGLLVFTDDVSYYLVLPLTRVKMLRRVHSEAIDRLFRPKGRSPTRQGFCSSPFELPRTHSPCFGIAEEHVQRRRRSTPCVCVPVARYVDGGNSCPSRLNSNFSFGSCARCPHVTATATSANGHETAFTSCEVTVCTPPCRRRRQFTRLPAPGSEQSRRLFDT